MVYDVAICGAGLAGLTLARQLSLQQPELKVLIFDRVTRPLPTAAFKVGESTVQSGARYLQHVLNLEDYFPKTHVNKLGLRYFFGDSREPLERRPELGRSRHQEWVNEWNFDRGVLERDLRELLEQGEADFIEGASLQHIELSPDAEHVVTLALASGEKREVHCHWVIDATGRRQYLQRKLGLRSDVAATCSASWWRVPGRIDIDELATPGGHAFTDRIAPSTLQEDPLYGRYNSTNHLMGNGYWVWLIPLSGRQHTSVGIVADEGLHQIDRFNTYERSLDWLQQHEPRLHERIAHIEPLDFRMMRKYSYSSQRIMSHDRWACVGEAGVFSDPFRSPGTSGIGYQNTLVCEAIRLERAEKLTPAIVDGFSSELISWSEAKRRQMQRAYPYHGDTLPSAMKIIWDFFQGGRGLAFWNSIFCDRLHERRQEWRTPEVLALGQTMRALGERMLDFFDEWHAMPERHLSFEWIDYLEIPTIERLWRRAHASGPNPAEAWRLNSPIIVEAAEAIVLIAIEDTMPEAFEQLAHAPRLRLEALSMDPSSWVESGFVRHDLPPNQVWPELRARLIRKQ